MKKSSNFRLIIFFIPPEKIINGGILSIFSICTESRKLKKIHKSKVVLSTYPGTKSYRKNDLFKNEEIIYSFDEIVSWGKPKFLQLHVPEYASLNIFFALSNYSDYLKAIPELSINIMTQNVWLLQKPYEVANWFLLTPNVTQTIAHKKTATQELADRYYLPTHFLSVFNDPSQYKRISYEQKENLILLSPDETEKKTSIINTLSKELPTYKTLIIKNLPYDEYKKLIGRAKFTITFGEGFDGYFIETFFSGGIAFAVYNDDFFPDKDFIGFMNIYRSYDDMLKRIIDDIKGLDNKIVYGKVFEKNLRKITKIYNFSTYLKNLEDFYRHKFTYIPSRESAKKLIADILTDREKIISERDTIIENQKATIKTQDRTIAEQNLQLKEQAKVIEDLYNSTSWKITMPLRKVAYTLRKIRRLI